MKTKSLKTKMQLTTTINKADATASTNMKTIVESHNYEPPEYKVT